MVVKRAAVHRMIVKGKFMYRCNLRRSSSLAILADALWVLAALSSLNSYIFAFV